MFLKYFSPLYLNICCSIPMFIFPNHNSIIFFSFFYPKQSFKNPNCSIKPNFPAPHSPFTQTMSDKKKPTPEFPFRILNPSPSTVGLSQPRPQMFHETALTLSQCEFKMARITTEWLKYDMIYIKYEQIELETLIHAHIKPMTAK